MGGLGIKILKKLLHVILSCSQFGEPTKLCHVTACSELSSSPRSLALFFGCGEYLSLTDGFAVPSGTQDGKGLGSVHSRRASSTTKMLICSRISIVMLSARGVGGGCALLWEGDPLQERPGHRESGGCFQDLFFQVTSLFYPESLCLFL